MSNRDFFDESLPNIPEFKNVMRPVNGHEERYWITAWGNVYSTKTKKFLKPTLKHERYLKVVLYKEGKRRMHYIHALVLENFIGPRPKGYYVCHNDGDRTNNLLTNLRWDSPKSNCKDKIAHGTHVCGEKVGSSKLTKEKVLEIRELHGLKSSRQVGKIYGVRHSNVLAIWNRKAWKHV